MLTVVIFWQKVYMFFHIFPNDAFSEILNECGQLVQYKKIHISDNSRDLIDDP